jgi:hypothetical protein
LSQLYIPKSLLSGDKNPVLSRNPGAALYGALATKKSFYNPVTTHDNYLPGYDSDSQMSS